MFCPGYLEWWLDSNLHLVLFIQYILNTVSIVLSKRWLKVVNLSERWLFIKHGFPSTATHFCLSHWNNNYYMHTCIIFIMFIVWLACVYLICQIHKVEDIASYVVTWGKVKDHYVTGNTWNWGQPYYIVYMLALRSVMQYYRSNHIKGADLLTMITLIFIEPPNLPLTLSPNLSPTYP